ncbi:NAD(P)-dependent oxidoreductase [uncultured Methylovirgula sp.]|uniref:NAD(P)-dependent oxidoreductase n=1 Tax=uncultured Methylovirgula sp. TaxID=1285960 RepID=UPI00262611A2|nr:NAD(P)-dependent oxidoreductase [uncultured Methylovirgula sp.]
MDVGFIGLGGMGAAMASRLIAAGHRVRVWNRSQAAVETLRGEGAEAVGDPAETFQADVVLTMLASDEVIEEVIIAPGLLAHARPGLVHLVTATISVDFAKRLETLHAAAGVAYIGAPVLGRPDVAAKGELNVLAAGKAADIARVKSVLDTIGKATWVVGEAPHLANVAKLAANFVLVSAIEAMSEAFAFGERQNVPPRTIAEILTGTLFAAPAYKTYSAAILERKFEAGFKLALGLKDVRLMLAAGEKAGAPLPFASVVRDNFVDAIAHGEGDKDWAAVSRVAFRRAALADE